MKNVSSILWKTQNGLFGQPNIYMYMYIYTYSKTEFNLYLPLMFQVVEYLLPE